jgi:methyltransferase
VTLSIAVLAFVTLQRLGELALARRNTRRLLAEGGVEVGAGHYPWIVGFHALWLAGLWLVAWDRPVHTAWLLAFFALQVFRLWVIATLGQRWTTRIILVPDVPLVRTGPYRWLRHPNYAVVAAEIAVLPLAFGLPAYAAASSAVNAGLLFVRIRTEDAALRA